MTIIIAIDGYAILRKRRKKLRENLSDIGPGLLFDRTDQVLQERRRGKEGSATMTISKYEGEIAKQSRQIIESALKPLLDKIEDLNNHTYQQQPKTGDMDAAV